MTVTAKRQRLRILLSGLILAVILVEALRGDWGLIVIETGGMAMILNIRLSGYLLAHERKRLAAIVLGWPIIAAVLAGWWLWH
jgi:hypothetical protein